MSYVVTGLPVAAFQPLFGLSEAELADHGAIRYTVAAKPGSPCRITLEDAEPGESVLLLNYEHHAEPTPYRSNHAIFVREAALETARFEDRLPPVFQGRLLSIRAFGQAGMMVDAEVLQGAEAEPLIQAWLERPEIAYLHAHNAKRGCYSARIERS
ncbi:DUF1203 domain-containing protein [Phenylobacterium montanum]|uniref:DUF1203 domain-containing protein n=1 Tax=Phenylobacterium montanum TaxID=2823693 RepID=A0A975G110_9CAUL|nr:DUF1203 domain-containing protein [Caulobacter sp. S6]QUD89143.1 DUF1203 domain-containing protein [Caulobacter sp. S6]